MLRCSSRRRPGAVRYGREGRLVDWLRLAVAVVLAGYGVQPINASAVGGHPSGADAGQPPAIIPIVTDPPADPPTVAATSTTVELAAAVTSTTAEPAALPVTSTTAGPAVRVAPKAVEPAGPPAVRPARKSSAAVSPPPPILPPVPPVKDHVERILDTSGWDWRSAGVTVHLRYHPGVCCHWGVYDYRNRSIWIGPSAFRDPRRLRYVVLHELAHAWLLLSGKESTIVSDLVRWRSNGIAPGELAADCIALLWGGGRGHYWRCPPEAQETIARRLHGDWS